MVAALVAIVVLAVVIYLGALYFQRLNNARISAIEDITAKIEANSQEDELAAISKLNLTGESLAAFEELDKSYRALINRELPFLVERLKDVKEANQHFSFPTVKSDLETLEAKGAAANMAFTKIIKQIKQIKQQTDQHQQNIDSLQTKYQEIRKNLLAKNFSYGAAITRLEAALADLEKDFKEYENIAENGDYVKADKALAKLKDDTKTL
ncbi:MAG: septation ring formation regulator EzrA, partial [Ligilactobacillus agilis]|nr:septation ring formation regulator EzrA [Ligilactobacillus agilis]